MTEALLKKLNYKGETPILALAVPEMFEPVLEATGAEVHQELGNADCYPAVSAFVATVADAQTLLGPAAEAWKPLAQRGFEPVRQVALDDDWSALRFRPVQDIASFTRGFAMSEEGKKRTKG